jgi:hypothetical protein
MPKNFSYKEKVVQVRMNSDFDTAKGITSKEKPEPDPRGDRCPVSGTPCEFCTNICS